MFTYEPDLYQFDVRGQCYNERRCENLNIMDSFLNSDNVKLSLNVSQGKDWLSSNDDVYDKFYWMLGTDFSPFVNII